jgi:sigma-B regulation protein RsbU (phosphoserine phosphatase)
VQRPDAAEHLPPGSTVLLYTDGLIENRHESLDDGMTRLRRQAAALATAPLDAFCDGIMEALGSASSDDTALTAVRIPAAAPADRPAGRDGA